MKFLFFFFLLWPIQGFAEPCNIIKVSEKLLLQNCSGVHVLTLQGSPKERARLHGSLIGKELSPDVLNYFSEKILDPVQGKPAVVRYIFEFFYNLWAKAFHLATPKDLSEELESLAQSIGVSSIKIKRAMLLPDTASFINRLSSFTIFRSLPDVGCTSIAAKIANNDFIIGRNLDFASTTIWDLHPQITVQIPEEGSDELKHLAFGAAAVQFGGITGLNEAGITFAVHQNYTTDATLGGIPMFLIGELVLRKAKNLKEAEEILRKNRPGPLWTFVVSDLKSGEVMAVETSRRHFYTRYIEGKTFAQTNHVQHKELLPWEFLSIGTKKNSNFRYNFALKQANAIHPASFAPEKIAKILSYQKDTHGELSAYEDVLKAHTIQSIIMHRKKQDTSIYMAYEAAPTASGRYLRFSANDLWNKRGALPYSIENLAKKSSTQRKNQMAFAKSFAAYFDDHDYAKSYDFIKNQTSIDALLLKAILLYRQSKFPEAEKNITLAIDKANKEKNDFPPYMLQSLYWVKILSLYSQEKILPAKNIAEMLLQKTIENSRLKNIADKLIAGKTLSKFNRNLGFEFFSGDISGHGN